VVIPFQDPLSFRLTAWDDLEKKLSETKSRDEGENDLHLGTPGLWSATLYPEIFGVPETWLTLLSQVIRLANERELAENAGNDAISLHEYLRRAKDLERFILRWEAPTLSAVSSNTSTALIVDTDWVTLDSMLSALRHALAIYYYRRILDVNPEVLQAKVTNVRDSLFAVKQLCQSNGKHLNGLMWSAFIAGCEAQEPAVQSSFSHWFGFCTQRNGHASFTKMRLIMEKVWHEREKDQKTSVSWIRLLKDDP
jgi:arginine metabolism regulation protein II